MMPGSYSKDPNLMISHRWHLKHNYQGGKCQKWTPFKFKKFALWKILLIKTSHGLGENICR